MHVISRQEEEDYFAAVQANRKFRNVGDLAKLILLQGPRPEEVLSYRTEDFSEHSGELRISRRQVASRASNPLPSDGIDRDPSHAKA